MSAKRPSADRRAEAPVAARLLAWYDGHARTLPWRTPPGTTGSGNALPDPYRVWLSEIMLQQTTVAAVAPRFDAFVARWPSVAALAAADEAELMAAWAGLGYYARARNLHACARAVVARGGFPTNEAELRALPGVGAYTAAAIAAIAFGERAVVVDANVARVVARLFALQVPPPAGLPALRAATDTITPDARAGDFAQAMMDLGSSICTPRGPRCLACPLSQDCAGYRAGDPQAYPVRPAKVARPQRYGTVFWLAHGERVMLVRRPKKGLLGGMRALPTGPWDAAPPGLAGAPAPADWRLLDASVAHVFTHFRLELALAVADAGGHADDADWWPVAELDSAGLPTVFAKAAAAIRADGSAT